MSLRILCLLFIALSTTNVYCQRISLAKLLEICSISIGATGKEDIIQITKKLKAQANNWVGPKISSTSSNVTFVWDYMTDGNSQGSIKLIYSEDSRMPALFQFSFPYSVQYEDYSRELPTISQLVNDYTEKGVRHKVFESEAGVYALQLYSAALKRYFYNGIAKPYYKLTIHKKIN